MESEPVGETRQVVEDADDVCHLEQRLIVETEVAQRLPVGFDDFRWRRAELLGYFAQGSVARRQIQLPPTAFFDRFDERRVATFDTQKLCVRLRSVEAILRGRGDAGDHLPLSAIERARREHDLREQRSEVGCDPEVRKNQPAHRRNEAEVVNASLAEKLANLLRRGHVDPGVGDLAHLGTVTLLGRPSEIVDER